MGILRPQSKIRKLDLVPIGYRKIMLIIVTHKVSNTVISEEIEEDEEVIDVVVDDEENEEPEKKKGLSGLTWALIIAGVAAVPIAIGAVYFIQNRPSSRDYFDDDDEYDDDDYED